MSGIFPIVQPEAAAEPRRLPLCKEAVRLIEQNI